VFSIPLLRREPGEGSPKENRENHLNRRSLAPSLLNDTCQTDPDLARIVDAWPSLPDAIRAGILAMVEAASK
jgi:hypothetical protein